MIISVWRYSHLALAISSFLLLTVASITGIVLSVEPVMDKAQSYRTASFDTVTLSHSLPLLKEKFPGIQELSVDDNDFVLIKYTEEESGDKQVYVDPANGKVLGTPTAKRPFFQWMTSLHRSLFMHETGRLLMGITAFLLILISISGIFLVVQRQHGWKNFFSTIEKTGFAQYYHVVFGRIALFFILAIALTGTYLAIARFAPAPIKASSKIIEENIKEEPEIAISEFNIFKTTHPSEVKKIQYPFSDFPEDYYNLQLNDRELCINQFTGDILAEQLYTKTYQLANFSLRWHTGRSGTIWSVILGITSLYILFFIYSGFAIMLKRRRAVSTNKFNSDEANVIILVGSENGSTFRFADNIYQELIRHGEKVYLSDMNNYRLFPNATHLLIMTSTYGQGDPPTNAKRFKEKLQQLPQAQSVDYSVLGFGSRSYEQFCKFAHEVEDMLDATPWAKRSTTLHTIDEKSPQDFSEWLTHWTATTGFKAVMSRKLLADNNKELKQLRVVNKTITDSENAFMIRLKSRHFKKAVSGDLLVVYPKNDHRERLYSIGIIGKELQLSVKLHEGGLGSSFLHALAPNEVFKGKVIKNKHFRFPVKAKKVIMICNGTGIAPFLGMISENRQHASIELYAGFRYQSSFSLYESFLVDQIANARLNNIHLVLSREQEKEYVSHRLVRHETAISKAISEGAVVMICGSLSMQEDVMKVLNEITTKLNGRTAASYMDEGRILADCY